MVDSKRRAAHLIGGHQGRKTNLMERAKVVAAWIAITTGIALTVGWTLVIGEGVLRLIALAG